ncbi:MAG: putative glycosyltransferase, partial [Nocardioidaceae bacterium]|nr:putative glycosyltransferase [Nocardioidaceae bacterium]
LAVTREVSGVTGACVGLRREVFLEVGGLTELLPENFNDVDFSYKIRAAGYRILFTHRCELFHFETMTRTSKVEQREYDLVRDRWGRPLRDLYLPDYPDMPPTPTEKRDARRRHMKRQGLI